MLAGYACVVPFESREAGLQFKGAVREGVGEHAID